jgi:hypothetical protein
MYFWGVSPSKSIGSICALVQTPLLQVLAIRRSGVNLASI